MSNKTREVPQPETAKPTANYGFDLFTRSDLPVVVYYPVGNYNELKEFGRFRNLDVAMRIISNFNNPTNFPAIPEYKIFSLETGEEIFVH